MNTNTVNRTPDRNLGEIFIWWLMLAGFVAAALLWNTTPARAQQTGPLPAATPSDQPPPPPRANLPKQIGGKPNLSGSWTLNTDESDDAREAMREAGGDRDGSGGGGGPRVGMGGSGGGGWGHGGGGGGYGGGGHRGGGQQSNRENPLDDLSTLTIAQTATSATVSSESGRTLAQYAAAPATPSGATANSGSAGTQAGSGSSSASTSSTTSSTSSSASSDPYGQGDAASSPPAAQWKGSQLIAVTPGRRQGKTTRTYELSPDGKQLYVTTKVENPRFKNPVTFRLVYDPAAPGG